MENYNRIDLGIVPVGGVDPGIACNQCPAACCRSGAVLPLTTQEAANLSEAGTELNQLPLGWMKKLNLGVPLRKNMYHLTTDCGNLTTDEQGRMSCEVFGESSRPDICSEFPTGSYACVSRQAQLVEADIDHFVTE